MGRKKRVRLLALIDYDNIDLVLRKHDQELDFVELMKNLLDMGEVEFAQVFIPFVSYHRLPNINKLGFEILICQKLDENSTSSGKREDKVDSYMDAVGKTFIEFREITDIVIFSHDWHSNELFTKCLKRKKEITYFANPGNMKPVLRDLLKNFDIEIKPLPTKPRRVLK